MDKESARQFLERECRQIVTMSEAQIHEVMASHASNEAIGFAEWCGINAWSYYPSLNLWRNDFDSSGQTKTTAELYSKYQEEKHK